MRRALLRFWHRAMHCRDGEHRETVECVFGFLQRRCVDCGRHQAIGFVFLGASNRARHPWGDA